MSCDTVQNKLFQTDIYYSKQYGFDDWHKSIKCYFHDSPKSFEISLLQKLNQT